MLKTIDKNNKFCHNIIFNDSHEGSFLIFNKDIPFGKRINDLLHKYI